jgi:hypothetical protein
VVGIYKAGALIVTELPTHLALKATATLLSFGLIAFIFRVGEWLIRKHLWKSNPITRLFGWHVGDRISFGDLWYGETLYRRREQPSGKGQHEPFSTRHDVRIYQDALRVAVEPTRGENFPTWGSTAAAVVNDGLHFLYWVKYSDSRFPPELDGFEWLAPAKREVDKDGKGKPIILFGGFGHCVGGGKPTYSGATLFVRRGSAAKISVEDLPAEFRTGKLAEELREGKLS